MITVEADIYRGWRGHIPIILVSILQAAVSCSIKGMFHKTQIGFPSILQCTGTIKHRLAFLLSYSVQGL